MRRRARVAALVLAVVGAVAGACSSPAADISNAPSRGERPVAVIPLPQSDGRAVPAPDLPPRGSQMPPDTVPLLDIYRQGSADVLR